MGLAALALTTFVGCSASSDGAGPGGRSLPATGSVFAPAASQPELRVGMDAREALASCLAAHASTRRAMRTARENYDHLRLAYEARP
jgi:hypothetical protein